MDPDHAPTVSMLLQQLLLTGSVLSLLAGTFPMLFGQIRVKWMISALMSCLLFGIAGAIVNVIAPLPERSRPLPQPTPPSPPVDIDWTRTGLLLLTILSCILALWGAWRIARYVSNRRRAAKVQAERRAEAVDPAVVVRSILPDMTQSVDEALARITRLKDLRSRIGRAEDMDALVMIEKRVPSVMNLYVKASEASTEEEKRNLARTALGSVVEIGQMAEDARQRIAGDLRSDLDTETRYISSRAGWAGGLRAD